MLNELLAPAGAAGRLPDSPSTCIETGHLLQGCEALLVVEHLKTPIGLIEDLRRCSQPDRVGTRTQQADQRGGCCPAAGLAPLIERTKWKFAWTYARTYPHEYTTKALCSPDDHARLIDCIERYGVLERFGKDSRKYLYFEERRYWHMGDPNSKDPEQWPNVINRTWIDVRRHAANVEHRWTPEEVQLQMRLWEIQLEKSTDRRGSNAKA